MRISVRTSFERLFGDSGSTDPKMRRPRIQRERSILNSVTREITRLTGELGPGDRNKPTEHLDSVRDVERRIQLAEEQSGQELPVIVRPAGIPATFDDHVTLMFDLRCWRTSVI
jgi:hypothetical protein